jgi:predicted carbohydrate-binding protein with CBM5 and CBM33 domain
MRTRFALPVLAALAVALPVLFAGVASAHGYTTNPVSRSSLCAQGS